MRMPLFLRLAVVLGVIPFAGGCFFGEPAKRGSVEDELAVETDMALRTLDAADVANAIPSLAALAENAGRMDEVGLRIQTLMLIARTLDDEATLWPPDKAANFKRASRRHARLALDEAEDWRRFEPDTKEAVLLLHDARILWARLSPEMSGGVEGLLAAALPEAVAHGDLARATAWRLALCRLRLDSGRRDEADRILAAARDSFARAAKAAKKGDPAIETLRLALAEAEGDVAAHGGRLEAADEFYSQALEMARNLRRRGELRRLLLKLASVAERSADHERAAWYRRRAEGVTRAPGGAMREQSANAAGGAGGKTP